MYNKHQKTNTKKPHQQRKTFADTLEAQDELRKLIKEKIRNPILTQEEIERIPSLVAHAVLSAGSRHQFEFKCKDKVTNQFAAITFGPSIHSTLLKMERIVKGKQMKILHHGKEFIIDSNEIWIQLLDTLEDIFPLSLSESHLRSKESDIKEVPSAHDFNLDEEV